MKADTVQLIAASAHPTKRDVFNFPGLPCELRDQIYDEMVSGTTANVMETKGSGEEVELEVTARRFAPPHCLRISKGFKEELQKRANMGATLEVIEASDGNALDKGIYIPGGFTGITQ
jgi:hypothetical protein